ncbi:MAG: hypothetical protein BGP25_07250 [Lysobacterales bacterium 63-13]|nr:MAG: hypothetical protein BGP25_07250 [Xanthomonadales bacterium 63-13]
MSVILQGDRYGVQSRSEDQSKSPLIRPTGHLLLYALWVRKAGRKSEMPTRAGICFVFGFVFGFAAQDAQ